MAAVLAIVEGFAGAIEGRIELASDVVVETRELSAAASSAGADKSFDLLVLAGMTVEQQERAAAVFQRNRNWRHVPVLYVAPPARHGLIIPVCYRPDIDRIIRGDWGEPVVESRILQFARESARSAAVLTAGGYELDLARGRLSFDEELITLTARETEIMAVLFERANRAVTPTELIERGWGCTVDDQRLQNLRRHMTNIRRKLEAASAGGLLHTDRGIGYRVQVAVND